MLLRSGYGKGQQNWGMTPVYVPNGLLQLPVTLHHQVYNSDPNSCCQAWGWIPDYLPKFGASGPSPHTKGVCRKSKPQMHPDGKWAPKEQLTVHGQTRLCLIRNGSAKADQNPMIQPRGHACEKVRKASARTNTQVNYSLAQPQHSLAQFSIVQLCK